MKNNLICSSLLAFGFILINHVYAQVPVREEPHHKVVLENSYVRILNVRILPHDTTLAHIHAAASVMVFLSKSNIGTQIVGAQPVISDVVPGQTSYAAYDEKPIKHRVWNQGDQSNSLFHVMDIELVKKNPFPDSCAVLSQPGIKLKWQQKLVRSYNISVEKGKEYDIPKSNCAYLLIDISGSVAAIAASNMRIIKESGFIFFPPQAEIKISSTNSAAECVLLELK